MDAASANSGERTPHMNVRHLEIFWAVMRSGNQREAARLLGLSQPAVSKLLRYTEQRMGFPLFQRIRGRLQPTPEAHIFFGAVDGIFSRLEAAERLARDLRRRLSGRITITTSSAFSHALLPEAIARFLAFQPLMQVGVKILTPAEAVERVVTGEADIGLTFGPIDAVAVDSHLLRTVPIICALPPGHRLTLKTGLSATDLQGERLITATQRPLWGKMLEEFLALAGELPVLAVECTQSDVGIALAASRVGIAVMPSIPLRPGMAAPCPIRLLTPNLNVPVLAVTGRERPLPHAVSILIEQFREAASQLTWLR